MTDDAPILTMVCQEPDGPVTRCVYPLRLTPDTMKIFWEKARKFKYLFDMEVNSDFRKFCELLLSDGKGDQLQPTGLFWVVDDFVGVFYMTRIRPGLDAEVHYTFFDRRQKGREELALEMIRYAFRKYNFRRLSVEVPMYATSHAFRFVESLGFRHEGRRRKAAWHNDDWFDVKLFGILKEEALSTTE